jgi:hypothetical protein
MGISSTRWFKDRQAVLQQDEISYWIIPFPNRLRFAGVALTPRRSRNTCPVFAVIEDSIGFSWLNPKHHKIPRDITITSN